jgi:hypothetical protein
MALPSASFATVSDTIFDFIQHNDVWQRFPGLYLRAADSGSKTLEFYQFQFTSKKLRGYLRMLPVLAICRIGRTSPEIVAEMKQRFVSETSDGNYESALLVTLLKLGEEAFVRDNKQSLPTKSQEWVEAVLSESGKTEVGPNNCMAQEWGTGGYLSNAMAPSLRWINGHWGVRGQT